MITGPVRTSLRRRRGFSLLELVIAITLLSILVAMVFGTAQSALSLSTAVTEHQKDAMTEAAFFELLDQQIGGLPGNARLQLTSTDSGTQYLSDLTIQNAPMSFSWGGSQIVPLTVRLSTVKRNDGLLNIVLKYYDVELLSAAEAGTKEPEPFAEVVLLSEVGLFEWRLLDGRSMEWQYDWDAQGRLPLQLELVMTQGAVGPKLRHVLWIVPKQNPEVMMRQLNSGAAEQSGGAQEVDGEGPGGGQEGGGGGPRGGGGGPRGGGGGPRGGGGGGTGPGGGANEPGTR
jgi:prepilin-type N-terminal cleavage/methylation domain-containing protein